MNETQLRNRTKDFAKRIIEFVDGCRTIEKED